MDDTQEELDPQMVEAAIRAGEQAAQEDFARDAERARSERDELAASLAKAEEEAEKARTEAADAAARLARLQADWDNYRKRTAQERVAERERATEKLVEALLPAIDDLERAVEHAQGIEDSQIQEMAAGVANVHTKILGVLEREGVEVIDRPGEAFDPLREQAVGQVQDAEAYNDSVAQVLRRGYTMGGKVIRPAMVSVTVGGPKRPAPEDADQAPEASN
ncbi:nucleotide exchange factor GrpE [Leptogranulimonas caecicola]|jgi:molecular chaperone GrpE|uniref:Protein GrpE n=2 Tax=Coriobacteriales TaxID=84999 RepID=A0A4V3RRE5_9ACTN|nr:MULTISPECIES: nucleotide exchange factor GrpE [Atopobiaceae]MCI8675381.1 nucleotide exchange factor GrpE [Atopobiaceae bacterium]TGY63010.1 nucleotide exchange factor GrpE [Muricaecibacterium torontonense]BCV19602.1 hypothetical protein ATOBIA_N01370 [Atopobiaceae bacterium P1]BDC90267.1 hypothetical protein ATTO_01390 [Leptogranulimonas caecicola]